jgi:hypothetical protein
MRQSIAVLFLSVSAVICHDLTDRPRDHRKLVHNSGVSNPEIAWLSTVELCLHTSC